MRIPTIFHWPTPWFWVGLTILLLGLVGDSPAMAVAAVIVLAASVAHVARGKAARPRPEGHWDDARGGEPPGLDQRLTEIERRLTDTQDVMIALSEKMDRWEREGMSLAPAGAAARGRE